MKTDPYNFKERLAALNDRELVEAFNVQVDVRGWVSTRGHYLLAIQEEMVERGFDITEISSNGTTSGTLSLSHRIQLEGKKLKPQVTGETEKSV